MLFDAGPLDEVRGHHAARAALTAAVLDAQLRTEGTSLASYLGGTATHVDAGVAIGRHDAGDEVVADVAACIGLGYGSVKLKIAPGHDVDVVAAARDEVGSDVMLQVDANGSYTLADADHLAAIDAVDDIACLEQPLAPRRAPRARSTGRAAAYADRSRRDDHERGRRTRREYELGPCKVVSIKAGLVGGLAEARATHDVCVETGAGRARWVACSKRVSVGPRLIALASLPGFTIPGDLSGSARYFEHDVTEPFDLDHGRLTVPGGPGLGIAPLPDLLARCTAATSVGGPERPTPRLPVYSGSGFGLGFGLLRSHGRTITIESSGCSGSRRSTIGSVKGGAPE